jgi:hypothetical protein
MSPATGSSLPQYPIPPIPTTPICEKSRSGPTCVPDYSLVPRAQWDNYGWCEEEQRFVCCQPADVLNDDGSLFIPEGLVKSINQVRKERGQSVEPTTEIDLNVWTGNGLYAQAGGQNNPEGAGEKITPLNARQGLLSGLPPLQLLPDCASGTKVLP